MHKIIQCLRNLTNAQKTRIYRNNEILKKYDQGASKGKTNFHCQIMFSGPYLSFYMHTYA